ncbi:MAG TPA: hypothetical protein VI461_04305 [Chitinophagaceae bacterium]|nr:hypothetical protein [Chitinophagaceae bacterium]
MNDQKSMIALLSNKDYSAPSVKEYNIICFAHLTNSMAQTEGDFEKGEEFGSVDTLNLISYILKIL